MNGTEHRTTSSSKYIQLTFDNSAKVMNSMDERKAFQQMVLDQEDMHKKEKQCQILSKN
jgi:hypothetical protein